MVPHMVWRHFFVKIWIESQSEFLFYFFYYILTPMTYWNPCLWKCFLHYYSTALWINMNITAQRARSNFRKTLLNRKNVCISQSGTGYWIHLIHLHFLKVHSFSKRLGGSFLSNCSKWYKSKQNCIVIISNDDNSMNCMTRLVMWCM